MAFNPIDMEYSETVWKNIEEEDENDEPIEIRQNSFSPKRSFTSFDEEIQNTQFTQRANSDEIVFREGDVYDQDKADE